ncbi:biotin transporter BioY [Corynebacterium sp. zg-331]|uniref:biotin transporter BioY n=1 Tax=unclassified Corynebacterium TaxID=2624378 RepID=UPI00128DDD66|nr:MULTISPECIES: biotin transporter BioY [unclassified Corynebacterium]MBC3185380.1 biotin transporter BioY [Corynebacterium sp. zg-331]MPV51877.1 biotin transporter BioY [Corynebacterium sp. zg331]
MTGSLRSLTDLALAAVFAALIIVLAFVSIPVGSAGVPIVLQNTAFILTGLVLGARRGLLTVAIFFILGLVLPVLAGGRSVTAALAGPTVGYLIGYAVSTVLAGTLAYRLRGHRYVTFSIAALVALLSQYLCGTIGLILRAHMPLGAAVAAQGSFALIDALKLIVVVAAATTLHTALPHVLRPAHARD